MLAAMSDTVLIWSLPLAITLHNLEEAIWLPGWSEARTGSWHRAIGRWPFRFAVTVLTALAFLVATWAHLAGHGSVGHYLLACYALGQGLNVFFPHVAATTTTQTYMPGLFTGVCFVLPAASAFLYRAFMGKQLQASRFVVMAAVFIPLTILSIPLLFKAGRAIQKRLQ